MDEVNPTVEIMIPDPEPITTENAPSDAKPEELSPSYPQSVDTPITSDNLVPLSTQTLQAPETSQVIPSQSLQPPPPPKWTGDSCPIEECEHKKAWRLINNIPVHAGGRPCKYCTNKEEIDKISQGYLDSAREAKKGRKPFIPYQQELADMLDIDNDTLYQWTIKKREGTDELEHAQFSGLIKKLNTLKELLLLQRTTGRFNPTGAIFQLKTKHGYMETEKQVLAGDPNEPLNITIIEEDREKYQE